jgi:pyruvate dehydrogenase E1 component alpha subunit
VDEAARQLVARVREAGPAYLFARTYRHHPHNLKDSGSYRTQEEVECWKRKDPLAHTTAWLLDHGVTRDQVAAVVEEAGALVVAALAAARAAPWPPAAAALADVQDLGAPQ